MPKFKQVYIGVWEDSEFKGVVIFGLSITPHLGDMFDLNSEECAELTRIALRKHEAKVSEIGARAIKKIKSQSPGLRLLVSYADPFHNHNGAIYQAMNWIYVGESSSMKQYRFKGSWRNDSSLFRMFRDYPELKNGCESRTLPKKYKYLYPLDRAMRRQILPLAQPYPKRGQGVNGDTPTVQVGEAGSIPAVRSDMTGQEPEEPELLE